MSEAVISVRNLSKHYKNGDTTLTVLDRLDLTLHQGESAVIMGRSGSGKSTFLHILGGLDRADSGTLEVFGIPVHALKDAELTRYRRETIGFVFQNPMLLADFTALENVALQGLLHGMNKRASWERAERLLVEVGLKDRLTHIPARLSGGECQRVALARALYHEPLLLLADEPTGNLDEESSEMVEELMFSLVHHYARTLVIVTHDQALADKGAVSLYLSHGAFTHQEMTT